MDEVYQWHVNDIKQWIVMMAPTIKQIYVEQYTLTNHAQYDIRHFFLLIDEDYSPSDSSSDNDSITSDSTDVSPEGSHDPDWPGGSGSD